MFRGPIRVRLRRLALAGLAVAAASVLPAASATADPPASPMTFTVDKIQAHPGETVTITLTFTNPEAVDVTFSYASLNPYWWTMNQGNQYAFTSCTGGVASCWFYGPDHRGAALTHDVVIPPGATRTTTLTYEIAAESPCGGRSIDFSLYTYHEYGGTSSDLLMWDGPGTEVIC